MKPKDVYVRFMVIRGIYAKHALLLHFALYLPRTIRVSFHCQADPLNLNSLLTF